MISPRTHASAGLPLAVYKPELEFAEIQNKSPGQRQFDVIVNGNPYLIAFDIAALVGRDYALDKTTLVSPMNGEITVQLAKRQAQGEPILNAIPRREEPLRPSNRRQNHGPAPAGPSLFGRSAHSGQGKSPGGGSAANPAGAHDPLSAASANP